MGVDYELYCEAKIGGQWHSIDFYQRAPSGNIDIAPVISGRSSVGSALNWEGLLSERIKFSDLSPEIREKYGNAQDDSPDSWPGWATFDYHAVMDGKNYDLPEYCGYFPKDAVVNYQATGESGLLDIAIGDGKMLTPPEFAALTPEAQKGYMYYEYTEPFGYFDIMRRIKRAVEARIAAWEDLRFGNLYSEHIPDLDGPVRVVINMS